MKNWTIHQRLVAAAIAAIILTGVLVALSISRVNAVARSLAKVNEINSVKQRYAINFRGSVHDRAIALRDVTLAVDDTGVRRHLADIERLAINYVDSAKRLDTLFADRADTVSADERLLLDEIKAIEARALPLMSKVIAKRQQGDQPGAQQLLLGEAAQSFVDWLAAINRLIDHEEMLNKGESAAVASVVGSFAWIMTAAFVGLGVGVMTVLWVLGRAIRTALDRAIDCAMAIADGDLAREVDTHGLGETGRLLEALVRMRGALVAAVTTVRSNADSVASASEEITQGNQDLSDRTEQQASALQRTASTMEQLGATVRNNAENAHQANQLAEGATGVARKGGDVVTQVVETMRGIDEASRRIAEIIGTVDGIAFQTNILALNAAVEAARAGEQGRGFAVVAGEVRSLAQRSAEAARAVKQLIGDSVERVQRGSQLVDEAGQTMNEIVAATRRVSDIVAEISTATAEQSLGIGQVGRAVAEMDRGTQQNAALVEQSAAGAEALRQQSARLVEAVATFKLA